MITKSFAIPPERIRQLELSFNQQHIRHDIITIILRTPPHYSVSTPLFGFANALLETIAEQKNNISIDSNISITRLMLFIPNK